MSEAPGDGRQAETHHSAPGPAEDPLLVFLRQRYPLLAKDILRHLVDLCAVTRSICAGDAQKSEILLLIALRTAAHPDFATLSYEEIAGGEAASYGSLSTNVRSIADSSGIPRETVRRKVAELVAEGLVERQGNKLLLRPSASKVIGPVREAALRLVAANYQLVSAALSQARPERGPQR